MKRSIQHSSLRFTWRLLALPQDVLEEIQDYLPLKALATLFRLMCEDLGIMLCFPYFPDELKPCIDRMESYLIVRHPVFCKEAILETLKGVHEMTKTCVVNHVGLRTTLDSITCVVNKPHPLLVALFSSRLCTLCDAHIGHTVWTDHGGSLLLCPTCDAGPAWLTLKEMTTACLVTVGTVANSFADANHIRHRVLKDKKDHYYIADVHHYVSTHEHLNKRT
jgi:hypothetical protein